MFRIFSGLSIIKLREEWLKKKENHKFILDSSNFNYCILFFLSVTTFSSYRTIQSLGILTGAQLFSLTKEELRTVLPEEGARVYSQIMVQKSILEVCPEL